MKNARVVVLRTGGGELANQLWNYASTYAYALDQGLEYTNPAFFEYAAWFEAPVVGPIFYGLFCLPFRNYRKRKSALRRRVWRKMYWWGTSLVKRVKKGQVIELSDRAGQVQYLPPTEAANPVIKALQESKQTIYFDGWLFRNPRGLTQYRSRILRQLRPRQEIEERVRVQRDEWLKQYTHVVGVHIRQGDYVTWRGGAYSIPQARVRQILDEYLREFKKGPVSTLFFFASDGAIDAQIFAGLNMCISKQDAVTDLFSLASTDIVIGSNSTFGAFASYYGDVPFVVMQKGAMDWSYYQNKTRFFENMFSTMVNY